MQWAVGRADTWEYDEYSWTAAMIRIGGSVMQGRAPDRAWRLSRTFGPTALRSAGSPQAIARSLMAFRAPDADSDAVRLILSELVANAVDHGLLGLEAQMRSTAEGFMAYYIARTLRLDDLVRGNVYVTLENRPAAAVLRIKIADDGFGFDAAAALARPASLDAPYGRGLAMVRGLCARVAFNGIGNIVVAEYAWGSAS